MPGVTERTVVGRPITRRPAIDRDRPPREWCLSFVASVPVASAAQVSRLFTIRDDVPPGLIARLLADRLLEEAPRLSGRLAYRITGAGLRAIESDLPLPQLDLRRYRRDIGAGWLSVGARRGVFGEAVERVYTEREMRAADRRIEVSGSPVGPAWSETVRAKAADASFAVSPTVGDAPGQSAAHYPDLTLVLAQGRVALQLMLEVPSARWMSAVVEAYARKPHLVTTVLLVPGPALRASLDAMIERCGASGRVMVREAQFDLA